MISDQLIRLADSIEEVAQSSGIGKVRCEIIDGKVIVDMMSPSAGHGMVAEEIVWQIKSQDSAVRVMSDTNMATGEGDRRIPDVMVVDKREAQVLVKTSAVPYHVVKAAVEVVSPGNPDDDLVIKPVVYARLGIPILMVIDPRNRKVIVHQSVNAGTYRDVQTYDYGDEVPFGKWKIDTSELAAY